MKIDLEEIRSAAESIIKDDHFHPQPGALASVVRAVPTLIMEIRRLQAIEEAARANEWYKDYEWAGLYCIECEQEKRKGHLPDCLIGRALALKGCLE